ncbi:MAG: hypothetical protein WEA56_11740 [Balneolaceae bacterium]
MNVAIVGEKKRADAWEKHLRKLSTIKKVIITGRLPKASEADATILIDDSVNNLHLLHDSIKAGFHSYLVSKLPVDTDLIKKIYHASEEADVKVQFSHWPSISPSTQWIKQHFFKPNLIQIKRETNTVQSGSPNDFQHYWVDELALLLKWMGGNIHRIETKPILLNQMYLGLQLTLRFDDASIASIQFSSFGKTEYHQRLYSNKHMIFDCNIISQKISYQKVNDTGHIIVREKQFNPADTAAKSVVQFIKSIQMEQPTFFTPYDALITSTAVAQVQSLLEKG